MAFVTNAKLYLKKKLAASDTSFTADRDIGTTSGRIKFRDPNNLDSTYLEWISFSGVVNNGDGTYTYTIITNGRNMSLTAIPSTGSATGKTFGAGSEGTLVAMHDQLLDPAGALTFTSLSVGALTVTTSMKMPVYADTTTADAAVPSPSNGMSRYITALGAAQDYIAGVWTTRGTSTTVNATTTVAGKVQIATSADIAAGSDTGSTGATLVTPVSIVNAINAQDNIAGEAILKNDLVVYEYMMASTGAVSSGLGKYIQQKMGDVIGNTKISMKVVGNGISQTTLAMVFSKTGAPIDNLVVRIETDAAGVPSGNLANANATANIAGGGLTTGLVKTTVTFGGAFTLTDKTIYHIVVQRSGGIDPTNYYNIGACTKNSRMLKVNSHNGTAWQTEVSTKTLYCIYGGAYYRYIVKATSATTEHNWVDGIALAAVATVGQTVQMIKEGIVPGFTGLTEGQPYYLSSTAGLSTITGTAAAREIGYSIGTTKMYLKNCLTNPSNYEYSLDNINYYLSEGAIQGGQTSLTFRVHSRCRIYIGMTFSGGNGTITAYVDDTTLVNTGTSGMGATGYNVYPGQVVTVLWQPSTGAYGRIFGWQMLLPPVGHFE